MTVPSSSSLSHALNPPTVIQPPQTDLPRLQLAPPEHQKHLQAQAQARQQAAAQRTSSTSPTVQRSSDERASSSSSSREVSPVVGVETAQSSTGGKRKSGSSRDTTSKKCRTEQSQEADRELHVQYGLGTHYPYAYAYPGAPPPPPLPAFHPTQAQNINTNAEMSFNEFQWRLLNLCGEFYEAATELIRSTPHLVLSQAFQLLGRGTGLDPISVLNDARRTCDMMLVNPQALATAPPPPTTLPLPILSSLAHLSSRGTISAAPATVVATPSYYSPQAPEPAITPNDRISQKGKEKERAPNNVQGTWKDHEVQRLKALAEKYRVRDRPAAAEEEEEEEEDAEDGEGVTEGESNTQSPKKVKERGDIDWDKVVAEFGDERSRHQVLIKATYLGLKPSSSIPGKKPKRKRQSIALTEAPPPTFSSASAKSIPVGYSPSQLGTAQSSPTTPSVTASTPTGMTAHKPSAVASTSPNLNTDSFKPTMPPPASVPPQQTHAHAQYTQPGWYPHPQNPYYAYHQPMYYPPHPQGYGLQSYGMHTQPQQGYYGHPFVPPPGAESQPPEKQSSERVKRKEAKKGNGSASVTMPIPPPSLPPRTAAAESTSTKSTSTPGGATDAQASASSTPRTAPAAPPANTVVASTTTSSSGVLRRGPNNSLFTYTPLPHGPGGATTEQSK